MGVQDTNNLGGGADLSSYITAGKWHHIAMVADGGTATFYLDGVSRDTMSYTQDAATNPDTNLLIGAVSSAAENYYFMAGDIDEVAIWDSALSADAVTAVYNSGAPNNLNQDNGDYTNSGDLQGWWRMGEGNDPGYYLISDASGNGNDGTTQNEPAWSNDTPQSWPQNFSYYGIEFDGVDQHMTTTADDTLASKSYSFWAKASESSSNHVFGHGGIDVGTFALHDGGKPLLFLHDNSGDGYYYRYWTDIPAQDDGNWHHWAVVIHADITNSKLYCDGVLQSITWTDTTGSPNAYTTGIEIGRAGTDYFNGSLDEFAVFDGELTSAQVTALYNGGVPAAIAGAEHWYRMGEGNTVDGALVTDLAATDSNALYLPGVAGNYASVPDAADLDGFGDFTLEAKGVTLPDWTPSPVTGLMSKYLTTGDKRSWRFQVETAGTLTLYLSFDGAAATSYTSTAPTGVTDGATADLMVIRTGTVIRFYVNGVKLGDDKTSIPTTALYNSTDTAKIGMGYNTTGKPMDGSMERARIWNSAVANQATPTETPVLDMNFTLANKGVTSFTATSGQTVTVNTTSIADPAVIRQATDGVNVNSPAWTKNTPS